MSFSDLAKEQKQYIALGAIAAVVLVFVIVFGVRVSLSSIVESKQELAELSRKIKDAGRALSGQEQSRTEFVETTRQLKAILENTPPSRNYYSWATEIIYGQARRANLEIDAINEQNRVAAPSGGKGNAEIKLESYSLRIAARGGYGNIRDFLQQLEESQPLARVVGVDISTGSNPENHEVQLFVQWPFGMDAITDAWKSIAEKQGARDRRNPPPEKQPPQVAGTEVLSPEAERPLPEPPKKIVEAKSPVFERKPGVRPAAKESALEKVSIPEAPKPEAPKLEAPKPEVPGPIQTVEPEAPIFVPEPDPEAIPIPAAPDSVKVAEPEPPVSVLVPKPGERPDIKESAPKKIPPPPAPRLGAETHAASSDPVVPEPAGQPRPDAAPEVAAAMPEEAGGGGVPSGKFQSPESSGDALEVSLKPMETEPEPKEEEPATIPDEQENIISTKGESRQEGIGKSANHPEAQAESPRKSSDPTLEAMLEMFKE